MSFIDKILKKVKTKINTQRYEVMNGSPPVFTTFNGNAYESDIYRAAVDAIARNAAKLKPVHVVTIQKGQRKDGDSSLNRILQVRPNPYMTAYDMIYKLVTHYYLYNNAFALLDKDERGNLVAIYPLSPVDMEYLKDTNDNLYCKFLFSSGKSFTVPFNDVFTIRRFFNSNDLLGDTNTAILPTLELAHTQSEGMKNAIKSMGNIKGIIKYNQVLSPENLKKEKEAFVNDYLNINNNGGIAALDSKFDYIPIDSSKNNNIIDDKQLELTKRKIYDYLGISENIVSSKYSEDEWAAFYESIIEPLGLQFSLELTSKLFTQREISFGNSILMEANRLQFASNTTKTNILKELVPLGLFTINQALEILNLPSVEDGDRRVQTLNVASTNIIDEYQMNKVGGKNNEGDQKLKDTE